MSASYWFVNWPACELLLIGKMSRGHLPQQSAIRRGFRSTSPITRRFRLSRSHLAGVIERPPHSHGHNASKTSNSLTSNRRNLVACREYYLDG
jgi:hypothetical protein